MKVLTKVGFVIAGLFAAISIIFNHTAFSSNEAKDNSSANIVRVIEPVVELKTNMRKLWEDHVIWTRNVVLCLVDELPGKDAAIKRLLQNQVDIGNAIKPYYGEDAGKKLTKLLTTHILIAVDVVNTAKAGNKTGLEAASKKWYSNADEISEFLSNANPNWLFADMQMMMNEHLRLTTDEAVERIKKNYEKDVKAYDSIHNEILKMADMLTEGIAKQFPKKFEIAGIHSK